MPDIECRRVLAAVQLGPHHSAQIADSDLQAAGHRALRRAGDVDGGPAQSQGGGGVDAGGGEEGAEVTDTGVVVVRGLGLHGEAGDGGFGV